MKLDKEIFKIHLNKQEVLKKIGSFQKWTVDHQKKIISFLLVLSLAAMFLRGAANNFADGQRVVVIERNISAAQIIAMLDEKELLPGRFAGKLYIKVLNKDADLHSGRFVVPRKANIAEVMRILEEDGVVKNYISITISEGKSLQEIINILDEKEIVPRNEMEAYLDDLNYLEIKKEFQFLRDNPLSGRRFLEGYLFPDTYYFSQYSLPKVVIDSMLRTFSDKMKDVFRDNYDIHKIITMASIVEKEAVKKEEQKLIAGIFIKRLEKQMTLGSCPTVKYALGRPQMKFLLYKHLEVDSPYNTYKYKGLPPGPICSPGLDAVKAVLDPETTEYLYFVAKGDGTHQFSRTYQEHLAKQQAIGKIY